MTVEMSNDFSIENWDKSDEEIIKLIIDASEDYLIRKF